MSLENHGGEPSIRSGTLKENGDNEDQVEDVSEKVKCKA